MKKPIEPGCLCMIINSKSSTGKFVTAIEYIGSPPIYCADRRYNNCWKIDNVIIWKSLRAEEKHPYCPDSMLMRIDDYDASDEDKEVISLMDTILG